MAVVDRVLDHLKLTFAAEKPLREAVLPKLFREAGSPAGYYPDPVVRENPK
jgi:hypothetical protein